MYPSCVCGYPRGFHALGSLLCPDPPKNTKPKYRPAPVEHERLTWRQVIARDAARRRAVAEEAARKSIVAPTPPPLIPARPPQAATELAGYQGKQAVGLGRRALSAGWTVGAAYWKGHDGDEGCAVTLSLADRGFRAVATWKRPAAKAGTMSGWGADVAYAWRSGEMPQKCNLSDLEAIFT
jgi:hypothetical protein